MEDFKMNVIKTITPKDFEQTHFDKRYWDTNGGRPDKRPVWYSEDDGRTGRMTRIFINTTWFPGWTEWRREAERALSAASVEYDAFNGVYEKRGSSFPISGSPQFLVQKNQLLNLIQ